MSLISNNLFSLLSSLPINRAVGPSLGIQAKAIFCALLLATGGTFAASANIRRLEVGRTIVPYNRDLLPLQPLTPQYDGSHFSTEMKCHTAALSAFNHPVCQPLPQAMVPYVETVENLRPHRAQAAVEFPKNMEAFRKNGAILAGNGNRGCLLKQGQAIAYNCLKFSDFMVEAIKHQKIEKTVYTDQGFRETGFMVEFPAGSVTDKQVIILVGINPMQTENYRRALAHVSEVVLKDPCFFQKEAVEIVDFLKEVHKILMEGLPSGDRRQDAIMRPGEYRKKNMIVSHFFQLDKDAASQLNQLKSLGANEVEQRSFESALEKINPNTDAYLPDIFTEDELKVWEKLFYIAPPPQDVSGLMVKFAEDLKEFLVKDVHPVAVAAWALRELGRIHPFADGNGRLARLVMNTLLVRGGYEPVIITDDDEYTAALNGKPEAVAEYLARLIEKQSKEEQLFIRA